MILQLSVCVTNSPHDISEQATIQNNKHMAKLFQLDKDHIFIYLTSFWSLSHPITANIQ